MPNGQQQPTAEAEFVQEAEKELTELMREVGETDRRHGPKRRTLAQDADLLLARIDALEQDRLVLLDDLDALLSREEPEVHVDRTIEDEARFLREGKRAIDELVGETWGPPIRRRSK